MTYPGNQHTGWATTSSRSSKKTFLRCPVCQWDTYRRIGADKPDHGCCIKCEDPKPRMVKVIGRAERLYALAQRER